MILIITYAVYFNRVALIPCADILQFEVSTLTIGEFLVFIQFDSRLKSVEVSTIVGDVQLTVAIHHREVAATVEASRMLCADGDEVTMIDIIKCRRGIAINRCGISIGLIAVRSHIATGKHSVMYHHATFRVVRIGITIIQLSTSEEVSPYVG